MKRKNYCKIINIEPKVLQAIIYYKRYNYILQQAVIEGNYNTPKIKLISDRFNRLVEYLDRYIIYDNVKLNKLK